MLAKYAMSRPVILSFTEYILQRAYHDLAILPSNKPVISYGPPGYSAAAGQTVTVFGCTGFLGRYLISKLGMFKL